MTDASPESPRLTPRFRRVLVSVLAVELAAWAALWLLQARYR